MEGDPTQNDTAPAADPSAEPDVAQEPAGESEGRQSNASMNDFLRGVTNALPTSKPEDTEADGESTSDSEGVKPSASPRVRDANGRFVPQAAAQPSAPGPSRRGAAEEIARLKQELEARDPEKIRAQVRDELARETAQKVNDQRYLEDEARFQRLVRTPDSEISGEDYQWREEQKERRARYPEVEQHYQRVAEQRIALADQQHEQFLRERLSRHVSRPGVERETFRSLTDWGDLGDHLYDAGGRARQPEIDDLTRKLEQAEARIGELELDQSQHLRLNGARGLGSARAPIGAGRSGSGSGGPSMDDWIRGIVR